MTVSGSGSRWSTTMFGRGAPESLVVPDPSSDRIETDGHGTLLATPVEEGVGWYAGYGTSWIWSRIDSVTVPAGTFSDCWRKGWSVDPNVLYEMYCRGVGPVKMRVHGYVELELASTNFL
jgi:hypothetical protein